jgi:hypothetical protein
MTRCIGESVHAGVRHLLWDNVSLSNMSEKDSMLDIDEVRKSSDFVLYGSGAVTALLALYYYTA